MSTIPPIPPFRVPACSLVLLAAFLMGCGCGGGTSQTREETPQPEQTWETGSIDDLPVAVPTAGAPDDAPPRQTGTSPAVGTVDEAVAAANRGFYEAAATYLEAQSSAEAKLALGRIHLARGRYDDAARLGEEASQNDATRIAGKTLQGEAQLARGLLDEAEQTLSGVAGEAGAFRAQLVLGELLVQRGRSAEARPWLFRLITAYNDETIDRTDAEGLAYVGRAARALGSFRDANDAFQESNRADGNRVETQLDWAEMFLEKYDAGHAEESVLAAFEINPESARAHALMARIKIEQSFDFSAANAYSERALEINPNLVTAHVNLAGMDLRDMDLAAADEHLNRALQVNPNDLETLSVRAAVRFLDDDEAGFEAAKAAVFDRNRRFSRMYTIIGEYADWEHRYPEIVAMAREAVSLDPNDAFAHATLGLNLLRMGDEEAGLQSLRMAWDRDRYNVHVFNTLNLYDDIIQTQYETFEAAPFTFRMHREERPVLERYIPPTLQQAYESMKRRYGFEPEGPLRIELFSEQQHFSVRTTGLPNLGVQGVCFGKVVTALSPRGGPFNWGQITWHELAHVFHIQLSANHVPRWFTEGLAEYETIIARPEWRREEDHRLHAALVHGTLPRLRHLNRAFTHARSAEDMMVAYYASSMVVKYIVERFGFEKVVDMMRGWADGKSSPEIVQEVLGLDIDQLDADFRAQTRRRLAARDNQLSFNLGRFRDLDAVRAAAQRESSPDNQAALAASLMVNGEAEEAKRTAEAVIAQRESHPLARFILAQLAGQGEEAERHLRAILAGGKDGYDIRLLLARAAIGRRDATGARRELEAAIALDDERAEAWQGLMAMASENNDADLRLRAMTRLADLDQHSRATWIGLIEALAEREQWNDVRTRGESALFIDPENPTLHRLLGEAYLQNNQAAEALEEFDVALLTRPEAPGRVHLGRARALSALRRGREAREAAQAAVAADPSLADEARQLR
ncbi:MAG: tetratricopeptide repeat protein [Myxococcota bacterium]